MERAAGEERREMQRREGREFRGASRREPREGHVQLEPFTLLQASELFPCRLL